MQFLLIQGIINDAKHRETASQTRIGFWQTARFMMTEHVSIGRRISFYNSVENPFRVGSVVREDRRIGRTDVNRLIKNILGVNRVSYQKCEREDNCVRLHHASPTQNYKVKKSLAI